MKLIVQPEAGVLPIVHAIRHARKAIDVCIFRFDLDPIERELGQAVTRGVPVRALIASTNRGGEAGLRKLEQRLLAAGVTVSRSADDLLRYHGKFMIVDDTLHVFGFNFTKLDIAKSRSFGLATRDHRTLREASKLFEADSLRRDYLPARSNLVVSPDTSRAMLTAFIRGARKELAIYDQKVQDPVMIKLLKDRAAKGVHVRIIGSVKGPDGGLEVHPLKGMRLHVRALIRDGTRAFVGSQSLRKEELDSRREVGLLINNPTVTRQLMKIFEADWLSAAPKEEIRKEEKKEDGKDASKEEKKEEKKDEKTNGKNDKKEAKEEKAGA